MADQAVVEIIHHDKLAGYVAAEHIDYTANIKIIDTANFGFGDADTLSSITDGDNNIAIGGRTGQNITVGNANILIGEASGREIIAGAGNTCVGFATGGSVTIGNKNVFLGAFAGFNHTTESDILIIDSETRVDKATEISKALLYGYFENHVSGPALVINGTLNSSNHTINLNSSTASGVIGLDIGNAANITRLRLRGNNDAGAFIIHNESMATRMFYETGATFELRTADLDKLLGTLDAHTLRWTCAGDGKVTMTNDLIIPNDGWIGSVGGLQAIKIDDDGDVSVSKNLTVDNTLVGEDNTRFGSEATDIHTIWGITTIGDNGSTNNIGISATGVQTFEGLGGLVIDKTAGLGVKINNAAPAFGWRDLEGFEIPDPTGGDRPTLSTYSGGATKENAFSNGDVLRIRYHIPHDYVKGTDIFSHIHWSHNGTAISGNVVFGVTSDYSKGHNQTNFGTEKSISIIYTTTNISTTPRYRHRIEEAAITNDGGSGTLIDRGLLEPDGIILVTFELTTNPTITGGSPNNVFVHRADLHYQSTNIATKNKISDFYT